MLMGLHVIDLHLKGVSLTKGPDATEQHGHTFYPYACVHCGPPGSSMHGISQVRILECVAVPSPGDLCGPETEPRSPGL